MDNDFHISLNSDVQQSTETYLKKKNGESIFILLENENWKGCRLWYKVSDAERNVKVIQDNML